MKKSNNSTTYLEVPEAIYNSIPLGECQVHVYNAEIVDKENVKGIKLFCSDADGKEGEYLIFYSTNTNHVYGQLIRALSRKKVTKLELSKLIGKQLFVNIGEGKGYRNITFIERVGKSDYFEVVEEEYEEAIDEDSDDYEDDDSDAEDQN